MGISDREISETSLISTENRSIQRSIAELTGFETKTVGQSIRTLLLVFANIWCGLDNVDYLLFYIVFSLK
jgi:hypothetical protein